MLSLTPQLVVRLLVPASYLVFFAGLMVSGAIFYAGKTFDPKQAIISDLESPEDNPKGYGAAAAGTAACAILLAPGALLFYRRLRKGRPKLALAGAVFFALGLGGAIAIGLLAPFTRGYTPVHIQLAYAAFIGICGGVLLHLIAARAPTGVITLQGGAWLFLVYLYFGPEFFDNGRLLTSLALWEWLLCLNCAAGLWVLAATVAAAKR